VGKAWVEVTDKKSGLTYYYNRKNGMTSWLDPYKLEEIEAQQTAAEKVWERVTDPQTGEVASLLFVPLSPLPLTLHVLIPSLL
jgi:hypothetical protein